MKTKNLLCCVGLSFLVFTLYGISFGENKSHKIADSYLSAVVNNDVIMSTEEKFENSKMVLPIDVHITFDTNEELDGLQYGYINVSYNNKNSKYSQTSASSDKKVTNGLYNNKIPMFKKPSGREDIKWFYYSVTEYSPDFLVFIKFSIDTFTSEWIPVRGVPLSPDDCISPRNRIAASNTPREVLKFLTKRIELAIENPSPENFKMEGIRVIYGCDINVIKNELYQAYRFVNGDKQNSQTIISSGAKYMDLKESVLNTITYEWKSRNQKTTINSIDKINFYDEMTKEVTCKENFEEIQKVIEEARYHGTDILDKDRQYYEALNQKIQETELTEKQKSDLENQLKEFLIKYDELANEDAYNKNFQSINIELLPFINRSYVLLEHDRVYYESFYDKIKETEMFANQKEDLQSKVGEIIKNYDYYMERKLEEEQEKIEMEKKVLNGAITFVNDLIISEGKKKRNPPMQLKGDKKDKDIYVVPYQKTLPVFRGPGRDFNHEKYDVLLKVYNIKLDMLNAITTFLICNELSEKNNLSKCYKVKKGNRSDFETDLEYFLANFNDVYCDSSANGWHYPNNDEINFIQTKHKKNMGKILTNESLAVGEFILHQ